MNRKRILKPMIKKKFTGIPSNTSNVITRQAVFRSLVQFSTCARGAYLREALPDMFKFRFLRNFKLTDSVSSVNCFVSDHKPELSSYKVMYKGHIV